MEHDLIKEPKGFITGPLNKINPELEKAKVGMYNKTINTDSVALMSLDEEFYGRGAISRT